jgi:hypothetical protein
MTKFQLLVNNGVSAKPKQELAANSTSFSVFLVKFPKFSILKNEKKNTTWTPSQ